MIRIMWWVWCFDLLHDPYPLKDFLIHPTTNDAPPMMGMHPSRHGERYGKHTMPIHRQSNGEASYYPYTTRDQSLGPLNMYFRGDCVGANIPKQKKEQNILRFSFNHFVNFR